MVWKNRSYSRWFLLSICVLFLMSSTAWAEKLADKKKKGYRFPAFQAKYFQVTPKKKMVLKTLNFARIVGKQPIVLIYFMIGHKGSETELKAVQAASQLFKGKIRFIGITRVTSRKGLAKAYKWVKKQGVTLPIVLDDPRGMLAYVTLTRQAPSYSIVSKKGYLRLARASSLSELVKPGRSLMQCIADVARGKTLHFTLAPGYSPNPYNVVGTKIADIKSHLILKPSKEIDLKDHYKGKKPLVLAFWSVTCPHCRKVMPRVDRYAAKNKDKFELVSFVQADKSELKKKVKEFVSQQKLRLKILSDTKGKFSSQFKVLMVPTFFLVNSKGKILSVLMGGSGAIEKNLGIFVQKAYPKKAKPAKKAEAKKPAKKAEAKKSVKKQ